VESKCYKKYPIVVRMARDILGISVFAVASESAFSTGGQVVDESTPRGGRIGILANLEQMIRN